MSLRKWRRDLVALTFLLSMAGVPTAVHAQQTGGTGGLGGAGGSGGGMSQSVGQGQTLNTSFAGGSAGSSFSGGVSFSGGTAGSMQGPGTSTNVGRLGGAAGGALVPSTYNPFRGSYVSPLSVGVYTVGQTNSVTSATGATKVFGQPLYPITGTTGATGTTGVGNLGGGAGGLGGRATGLGGGGLTGNQAVGFSTFGTPRAPLYITTLDESIPTVQHSRVDMERKLEAVLRGSTSLRKLGNVDVAVEADTVVLRGQVNNPRERKLAEAVVRLTPGVREVRNELTVLRE